MSKQSIILVAFGTSSPKGLNVFDYILNHIKNAFENYDIRLAFSSETIVKKLRASNIVVDSVDEVLSELKNQSVKKCILQPLYILPSYSFDELCAIKKEGVSILCSAPLLNTNDDVAMAISAIENSIKIDVSNTILFHGCKNHKTGNEKLNSFKKAIAKRYSNVLVKTLSDDFRGAQNIIPFMLCGEYHIKNDILGKLENSSCSDVLGFSGAIIDIFIMHIKNAISAK